MRIYFFLVFRRNQTRLFLQLNLWVLRVFIMFNSFICDFKNIKIILGVKNLLLANSKFSFIILSLKAITCKS